MLRIPKRQAINLVIDIAPDYVELLREFQTSDRGWLIWPQKFIEVRNNLKLENYVLLYQNELSIGKCMGLALLGKQGYKEWEEEMDSLVPEQQQDYIEELISEFSAVNSLSIEEQFGKWPETEEEKTLAKNQFEALPQDEKNEVIYRASCLYMSLFANIHNYFSLMVTGEKLTSLVAKALAGDDEAFCRSVKIDRNLLVSHPYFVERYRSAQIKGERKLLSCLSTAQSTPGLIGRIRYPGVFIVFGMLQLFKWLDDLTHEEILDICDAARLDRWENRIEDVNYLTKRLASFRKYQKTGGVSMH